MTPLPSPSLKSAEEVAKEIKRIAFKLSHEYGDRKDWWEGK